jgi:hypothetical protein
MNLRQHQMIALSFLSEKIADCKDQCMMANESGIDSIALSGWLAEDANALEDFKEWMAESCFKSFLGMAESIFEILLALIGKQRD